MSKRPKDTRTREEKLNAAYDERLTLQTEREQILLEWAKWESKRKIVNSKLKSIGQAIHALKHDGDTPLVTDHAIVRYLERFKGIDISDLKWEIEHHRNAHREGNVILTVLPDRSPEAGDES